MKGLKALLIVSISFLCLRPVYGQNREKAQEHINTLAADDFYGRGYINQGDLLAAQYIRSEFRRLGLDSLNPTDGYFDPFELNVNTIQNCELKLDGTEQKAGYDYFVHPGSPSIDKEYKVFVLTEKFMSNPCAFRKLKKKLEEGFLPIFMPIAKDNKRAHKLFERYRYIYKPKLVVRVLESYVWSVSRKVESTAELILLDSSFNVNTSSLSIKINSELIKDYKSQNVVGIVRGTQIPDSFIVICGHYDHLGKMGNATFNGANDNASGIAMILDLASYFAANPQKYSILFIAFGGEEAGLIGSRHFVKHTPDGLDLFQIKFVFNLDLMGTGEDGATIVNGRIFTESFDRLVSINESNNYLSKIKSRGKAANSDHYFFSEEGIPSFFIYLMGEYTHYHIPADHPDNLQLSESYDQAFKLIRDFIIDLNTLN